MVNDQRFPTTEWVGPISCLTRATLLSSSPLFSPTFTLNLILREWRHWSQSQRNTANRFPETWWFVRPWNKSASMLSIHDGAHLVNPSFNASWHNCKRMEIKNRVKGDTRLDSQMQIIISSSFHLLYFVITVTQPTSWSGVGRVAIGQ